MFGHWPHSPRSRAPSSRHLVLRPSGAAGRTRGDYTN